MNISIRLAKESDLKEYTNLLQRTYQESYTDPKIGLTKECFSKEIFNTKSSQDYLKSNLVVNEQQKAWLAFLDSKMIGSITVIDKGEECQLRGFYVAPEYQGKGVGKQLWQRALDFASGKDIVLDLYAHNTKTIEMYKKWGFKIDEEKGTFYRHWPEWSEEIKVKCLYMLFSRK
ncbi:MAG TPA: GNAT family N-acetyltransferase [Candidatus Nanoarchaeia archaeon]|nr:hypothetical protein [uncultured archaeon]